MSDHLSRQRILDRLAERLDGSDAAEVDAHLRDCPACVDLLREIEEADRSPNLGRGVSPGPARVESDRLNQRFREMARVFRGAERNCRFAVPPEIPGYVLGDFLGQGGMGAVWAAFHEATGRAVALKVISRGEFATSDDLRRFEIEARAARDIAREAEGLAVVPVVDIGRAGEIHYIAMELADEGTLLDRIRNQPGDLAAQPGETARIFESLASTLHRLHSLQPPLFHRDIKPENILLHRRGPAASPSAAATPLSALDPLFSDFGLAKRQGDGAGTMTEQIVGTPAYMAPEQIRYGKHPTPAMEVYALGATLFHALTGEVPFQAETRFDVLKRAESDYPRFPRASRGAVPADLRRICLKCLEKDPARRYPSAQALADDLRRFQANDPSDRVRARGPGPVERTRRWVRSNRIAATTMLILALISVAALYSNSLQRQVAMVQAQKAHEARVASARGLARRGDWAGALRDYQAAIDERTPDRNQLRVERLFGFTAVNDGPTLAREVAELSGEGDLGPMSAPFDLARGAFLLSDIARQEEGRAWIARALERESELTLSPADPAYARALLLKGPKQAVEALRAVVRIDPLHFSASSSLVVALIATGNLAEARAQSDLMHGFFPGSPIPDFFLALVDLVEGDLPAMRSHLDRFAAGLGPGQAAQVDRLRAYCERLAKVLTLLEQFEATQGVRSPWIQLQLGLQSIGLAQEAGSTIGPFSFPVPTVGLLYRTLEVLPRLWLRPDLLRGEEGFRELLALSESFPDALILVLLINNRLQVAFQKVNAGDLDEAQRLFGEISGRGLAAQTAPTLLARSPIRYQGRILASIMDVSSVKVARGDALPAASRLRDNLHPMVAEGRRWPEVRNRGLDLFLTMLTVDMTREQLAAWKPDTTEGKAAYRERCRQLFRLARALVEDWQADAPDDPAPGAWLPRLDTWLRQQETREPVYFVPNAR